MKLRSQALLLGILLILNTSCHAQIIPREGALREFLLAATGQASYTLRYDPAYVKLKYPGGDVPLDRGVCTDVIIRAFRAVGIDLQKEVHEDMKKNFSVYPKTWGLKKVDSNIDHRRVYNLMCFFKRKKCSVPISNSAVDYLPGDIVAWRLENGLPHIGIVSHYFSEATGRLKIVHNIGAGVQIEDELFSWKHLGHYRWKWESIP